MNFFEFNEIINTDDKVLQYAMNIGLIPRLTECSKCRTRMNIQDSKVHVYGKCFRCNKCKSTTSLLKGTFFEESKLKIREVLAILYLNSMDVSQTNISLVTLVSRPVISKILESIRNLYSKKLNMCDLRLGGEGITIEIDESVISKAKPSKNNSARPVGEKWVFGMFDRSRCLGVIVPVESRDSQTLIPIIRKYCMPGSRIISDGWGAYNDLSIYGYRHDVVIHKKEFVVAGTDIHTNNIENYWKCMKTKFKRMNGSTHDKISKYLDEFMWAERFGPDCVSKYIQTLELLK